MNAGYSGTPLARKLGFKPGQRVAAVGAPANYRKLLAPLREEGVLVIGSGFSFHNMKAFFGLASADAQAATEAFEDWLADSVGNPALDDATRRQRLLDWSQAPAARYCHPREEHLLPLHVCLGAAGGGPGRHFTMEILGKRASAFLW